MKRLQQLMHEIKQTIDTSVWNVKCDKKELEQMLGKSMK